MKVLLLSHIFPPAVDGGSRVIYKLGQYLESQGHETLYLSSDCSSTDDFVKKESEYKKSPSENPESIIKLPVYHNLRRPLKLLNLIFNQDSFRVLQKGPVFKSNPFIKAINKIKNFHPDLIIAGPFPTAIILYASFLKKITGAKLLVNASFHPTDPDFQQKILVNILKNADYIWTLTEFETNYFIQNFNIDPQKIVLAGNGIDESFLKKELVPSNSPNLRPNILFIGSLATHKRVDVLIKAFSQLKTKSTLTIAGQKTLSYSQIEDLVNSLKPEIKYNINFIFDFNQTELSKIIDKSNFLVLPSTQESFGLVIIEAWARQKPVICADIPALKELVQSSNGGLLFKANNQNDLSQKIQELIDNPQKAIELGQNGFNYVNNNYTWNKVGQKICQKISC